MREETKSRLKTMRESPATPPPESKSTDVKMTTPADEYKVARPTFKKPDDYPDYLAARLKHEQATIDRDAAKEKYLSLKSEFESDKGADVRRRALAALDGVAPQPAVSEADVTAAADDFRLKVEIFRITETRMKDAMESAKVIETKRFKDYMAGRYTELWELILAASAIMEEERELLTELGLLTHDSVNTLPRHSFPLKPVTPGYLQDKWEEGLRLTFGAKIPIRQTPDTGLQVGTEAASDAAMGYIPAPSRSRDTAVAVQQPAAPGRDGNNEPEYLASQRR